MRGHFRYLRFKNFPMTPRTPQCEVFCPLLSSSEHSGVLEDSQPPTFPSVGLHPHTWPKWGCDTSQDLSRLQLQGKEAQASPARSDGVSEPQGDPLQRSATPFAPLEVATRIRKSEPESSGVLRTHQVPPKGDSSLPCKSDFFSAPAGLGRSSEG